MEDNVGQILTHFAKNRTMQVNEGQILKARIMQDNKNCIHHAILAHPWCFTFQHVTRHSHIM